MRSGFIFSLVSLFPFFAFSSAGVVLPLDKRQGGGNNASYPVSVARNDTSQGFGFTHVPDFQVSHYTATIHVNGVPYQVILDSGSSDTFIDPSTIGGVLPPDLIQTGFNVTTPFGSGQVGTGTIVLANVTFGPYTVNNQAIYVSTSGNVTTPGRTNGLLGLAGSQFISLIYDTLKDTPFQQNGQAMLYNLFQQEPELPSYMAWLQSGTYAGVTDGGVLTISEVLSNMTSILNATQYPSPVPNEWQTFLESVTVNGRTLTGHGNVSSFFQNSLNLSIPENNTVVTFDTGTGLIRGPTYYAEQIYGSIPGAQPINANGVVLWLVPCDTALNVSFTFSSGETFPIHPVDTTVAAVFDGNGTISCLGSIVGADFTTPITDWLLGNLFLNSVYTLFNYGNVSDPLARGVTQLLSLIDPDTAWAETPARLAQRNASLSSDFQNTRTMTATTVGTQIPVFSGTTASVALTSASDSIATPPPISFFSLGGAPTNSGSGSVTATATTTATSLTMTQTASSSSVASSLFGRVRGYFRDGSVNAMA